MRVMNILRLSATRTGRCVFQAPTAAAVLTMWARLIFPPNEPPTRLTDVLMLEGWGGDISHWFIKCISLLRNGNVEWFVNIHIVSFLTYYHFQYSYEAVPYLLPLSIFIWSPSLPITIFNIHVPYLLASIPRTCAIEDCTSAGQMDVTMTSYPSSMGVTRAAKGSSGKWNWKPMSNSPSMTCDAALNPAAIGRQSLIKYYKFINNKDYPTKKKKKNHKDHLLCLFQSNNNSDSNCVNLC